MVDLMKYFVFLVLLVSSCNLPALKLKPDLDPAVLKGRVSTIAAERRKDQNWMQMDDCPVDRAPSTNHTPLGFNDCKSDPEGCLKACEDGDGSNCWALARLVEDNDDADRDVVEVFYRKACALGVVSGCTNAAALLDGRKPEGKQECVARTFAYSCKHEDPWGCTMHGMFLAEGLGQPRDLNRGIEALEKACEFSKDPTFDACVKARELKQQLETREKR